MFALIDGNNFYCSAERCFRPSLNGRPIVVLSNNDGCAIARSNEAKDLGIKMGVPWFEIKHMEFTSGLVGLSANFVLYGDMSDRMHSLAAGLGPTQEIYSIDESFIGLHGVRNVTRRAHQIRNRIFQWTGLPCCIGIGQTKTLAKLGNHIAKTAERKPGSYASDLATVCNLTTLPASDLDAVFAATLVDEVWGVGRRIAKQLHEGDVHTVLDLVRMDPGTVRRRWSVVLERTVRELQGMPCIELEEAPSPKKEIACTRSFGKPVTDLNPLLHAVSEFASRAAEKLRKQNSLASQLLVFAYTSPFRDGPRFNKSVVVPLRRPTADTGDLVLAANHGMRRIYERGYDLCKAGVMLLDLIPSSRLQHELDLEGDICSDRRGLMTALDSINNRFGKGAVHMASTGATEKVRNWEMRQERRTPQYTTRWEDIPICRA